MKLVVIDLAKLQYLEASQFITRLFSDVNAMGIDLSSDAEIGAAFGQLETHSNEFYNALMQIKAMAESRQLEALDQERDHAIRTIRLYVEAHKYNNDAQVKQAFIAANIILDKYAGLEDLNYEAETSGIRKFLDEWDKPVNNAHASTLWLQPHLNNLRAAADNFDNVFSTRSAVTSVRQINDAKAIKKAMLDVYTDLAKYILAMTRFKKNVDLYPPLLNAFNNGRKYYADLLAKRGGNGSAPPATVEEANVQE